MATGSMTSGYAATSSMTNPFGRRKLICSSRGIKGLDGGVWKNSSPQATKPQAAPITTQTRAAIIIGKSRIRLASIKLSHLNDRCHRPKCADRGRERAGGGVVGAAGGAVAMGDRLVRRRRLAWPVSRGAN